MSPLKIAICEDHALFADGLRVLLSFHSRFQLTGQASDEDELITLLKATPVNILLLDLNLGPVDGFHVLEKVKQQFPETKILILTMYQDEYLIEKARKMGAHGYLLKNSNNEDLIGALDNLNAHDFYLTPSLQKIRNHHSQQRTEFIEKMKLTKRETEIIVLLAKGSTVEQISE